jgi:AraC-like DNA-binding protein
MGNQFVNVHIEVKREHYLNLLCDSEQWSSELKEKVARNEVYYPGEFTLSLPMIQTIHSIFNSTLSGSLKKLLIEAKVHELVALQLHHCYEDKVAGKSNHQRELFHSIREYLLNTFLEEHSLQKIARHFGVNEFLLKKGFKENFQTTVFDFILDQRMEYARRQLLDTKLTIHEVGSMVGYKYPNHFSTAFRKKFGVSPNSLKRS